MTKFLLFFVIIWVFWLLFDGLRKGEIWVKGGARDRYTRPLDMHSFASKVNKQQKPFVYWLYVKLYIVSIIILLLYLIYG